MCPKCQKSSVTADYCDGCGARIDATAAAPIVAASATLPEPTGSPVQAACPNCHARRGPADIFCELCGCDFATGTLPAAPTPTTASPSGSASAAPRAWEISVAVDPDEWVRQGSLRTEPQEPPVATTVALVTGSVTIGRASRSRNVKPDLDMTALTSDPAVSHRHARMMQRSDGLWEISDAGSANGTTLNGTQVGTTAVGLKAGDQIRVGAWTVVTLILRS